MELRSRSLPTPVDRGRAFSPIEDLNLEEGMDMIRPDRISPRGICSNSGSRSACQDEDPPCQPSEFPEDRQDIGREPRDYFLNKSPVSCWGDQTRVPRFEQEGARNVGFREDHYNSHRHGYERNYLGRAYQYMSPDREPRHGFRQQNEPSYLGRTTRVTSNVKPVQPTFDGNNCSWEAFLLQLRLLAKTCRWNEDDFHTQLILSMKGKALSYITSLQYEVQDDTQALIKALERRFGRNKLAETQRATLSSLRKHTRETWQEYCARVDELMSEAYPGMQGSDIYSGLAIEHFLRGIADRKLAYEVQLRKPRDLTEAVEMVMWHEACKQSSYRSCKFQNMPGKKFQCLLCGLVAPYMKLWRHVADIHVQDRYVPYTCSCARKFRDHKEATRHLDRCGPDSLMFPQQVTSPDPFKQMICRAPIVQVLQLKDGEMYSVLDDAFDNISDEEVNSNTHEATVTTTQTNPDDEPIDEMVEDLLRQLTDPTLDYYDDLDFDETRLI